MEMYYLCIKECVAVLCYIRKMAQLQVLDLIFSLTETACTMECRKVMVIHGYLVGLDWVMGKYHWKLQHILISVNTPKGMCDGVSHPVQREPI